jgi:hypothetical protein
MEAFLPGVGDWNGVFLLRDLWHFHFYGKTPLELGHVLINRSRCPLCSDTDRLCATAVNGAMGQ